MRKSPPVRPSSSLVLLALALVAAVVAVLPSTAAPAKKATVKQAAAAVDSLALLEAAVRRDSTNAKAQYRLGLAYLDRDRPQEALRAFQVATQSQPDYLEAWVNLGASNDAIGHGSAARENYRRALALAPGDEIALCRLASSFYAMGIKDSAMIVLRETIAQHPRSHCSYFTLGVAFADGGMFREAIAAWDKVGEYAPGSPEAESAQESVRLLKEYLGKDSLRTASAGKPGVPPGSGGPGEALPGGGMMNSSKPAAAAPAAPAGHSADDGHGHGHDHDHDHGGEKKKTGDK